jgi:hypothetical protein
MLSVIFGGYEAFKKDQSLLKTFYTFDKIKDLNLVESPHQNLTEILKSKESYSYPYCTFFCDGLASFFCCSSNCCKKRVDRLQLHSDSIDRLSAELDLVNVISQLRHSVFSHKLHLTKA